MEYRHLGNNFPAHSMADSDTDADAETVAEDADAVDSVEGVAPVPGGVGRGMRARGGPSRSDDEEGTDSDGLSLGSKKRPLSRPRVLTFPSMTTHAPGMLIRVECQNFMCHSRLALDFVRPQKCFTTRPHCCNHASHTRCTDAALPCQHTSTTFVTGKNGSGKSAIFAAVQLCLGSLASTTHRASNLACLVRNDSDADEAVLSVTLANNGDGSYKPEKYSRQVTVQRTIRRNGTSAYHLVNEHNVTRPVTKGELTELLQALNIDVSNTMVIMDQENSKKFLNTTAEQKYKVLVPCRKTRLMILWFTCLVVS